MSHTCYLDQRVVGEERTATWVDAVFARAYCESDGVFERVRQRLNLGFSVLAYVPGSCMDAAARYIISQGGGPAKWAVYGNHPGPGKRMEDVWSEPTGIMEILKKLLDRSERRDVVFKNLDRMFLDNNDGVIQSDGAQVALFSLIESTRNVSTLGLVDREFGKLPAAVEAAFNEKVWLDEISLERFPRLIPLELASKLVTTKLSSTSVGTDFLGPHVKWLLASRLRWSDPVRAVMIMGSVAKNRSLSAGNVREAIDHIWEAARPMEFEAPGSALPGDLEIWERALPAKIKDRLQEYVVGPYTAWRDQDPGQSTQQAHLEGDLASLPPGVILYGPPGTGKTLLARYLAKSIGLPIRVVSGADLRLPIHGQSERAIVDMFRSARKASPCVLVLDDADDLLGDRQQISGALAGAERAIVHTFLQEMAGFSGRPSGVLVILTTNRFRGLDQAIRSRVPLHIHVPYPLQREAIQSVVKKVAEDRLIHLSDDLLKRLVDRFEKPVIITPNTRTLALPEDRAKAIANQFSPRDIEQAMLLIRATASRESDGLFHPTVQDAEKMEKFYESFASSPEAEATAHEPGGGA